MKNINSDGTFGPTQCVDKDTIPQKIWEDRVKIGEEKVKPTKDLQDLIMDKEK